MSLKCSIVPVTPFQQNCSITMCETSGKAVIVDPGGDIERIIAAVDKMGATLEKIWLTHGHMDHCSAADVVRKHYGIPIEGPHIDDKFWIDQLPEHCERVGILPAQPFEPDRWLEDNDTLTLGDYSFDVKHCPGHTPGHVVFVNHEQRLAFVGDVLFQGSIGRTDFPRSNHDDLISSIKTKLWSLDDDITFVPGHGPTSTFGHEKRSNPFVADPRYR